MARLTFGGRVVVVTGAGRGLGRSYARLLAARGARVVVNNRSADGAQAVVEEIVRAGGVGVSAIGDLTHEGVAEEVVEVALREFGQIDALVNNAGSGGAAHAFGAATVEELEGVFEAFVVGPWRMTQAAWPHLAEQRYGRIVFISSLAALGHATHPAYATAKSAVHGLARSLRLEGAEHGILVNTVMPTAMTRGTSAGRNAGWHGWASEHMTADHVAPLVALLLHEDCPVSGAVLSARAGQIQLMPYGLTEGTTLDEGDLTPDALLERFDSVIDVTSFAQVDSALDAVERMVMPPR